AHLVTVTRYPRLTTDCIMLSTMCLYPTLGQDLYLLVAPAFTRTEMALGSSGKSLVIEAPEAREGYIYVKAVTLNGKPLQRARLRYHEIAQGAVLRFSLDTVPGDWGSDEVPQSAMQATDR